MRRTRGPDPSSLMEKSWPVMLVGNAGTGKSVLMGDKLDSLSTDDYLVH